MSKYKYMELYGDEVTIYSKEYIEDHDSKGCTMKDEDGKRWRMTTWRYEDIEFRNNSVVIDGFEYFLENYNKQYFLDKLRDKELGVITVQSMWHTIQVNMVYNTYKVTSNNGTVDYRVFDNLEVDGGRLATVALKVIGHKFMFHIHQMELEDRILLDIIASNKPISSEGLQLIENTDMLLWDKIKKLILGRNYKLKVIDGKPIYVYNDLIFGHMGKYIR